MAEANEQSLVSLDNQEEAEDVETSNFRLTLNDFSTSVANYLESQNNLRHELQKSKNERDAAKQEIESVRATLGDQLESVKMEGEENAAKAKEADALRLKIKELEEGKAETAEFFKKGIQFVKDSNSKLKKDKQAALDEVESLKKALAEQIHREECFLATFDAYEGRVKALRTRTDGGRGTLGDVSDYGIRDTLCKTERAEIAMAMGGPEEARGKSTGSQQRVGNHTTIINETGSLDMQKLRSEVTKLKQENDDIQNKVEQMLKNSAAVVHETFGSAQAELMAVGGQNLELQKMLTEAIVDRETYVKEVADAKLKAEADATKNQILLSEIQKLQKKINESEKRVKIAIGEREALSKWALDAESKIKEYRLQSADLEAKLKDLVGAREMAEKTAVAAVAQKDSLQAEINKLREEILVAEKTAAEAVAQKEYLEISSGGTATDSAKAYSDLAAELKKEKSNHITHVKKVKEAHEKEIQAIRSKHLKEINDIENAKPEPLALRKQFENVKVENKSLKSKIQGAENALRESKNLKAKLEKIEAERNALKKEKQDRLEELRALREQEKEKEKLMAKEPEESIPTDGFQLVSSKSAVPKAAPAPDVLSPSRVTTLDEAKEKLAHALNSRDAFKERCTKLEKELADIDRGFTKDRYVKDLRDRIAELEPYREKSLGLQVRIELLERDRKLKDPLVQTGAAIRLRFLAQAENVINHEPRESINADIIQKGNAAAHKGNGTADAALLRTGYLNNLDQFKTVYTQDIESYIASDCDFKKVLDIHATYSSSAISGRSSKPRAEYDLWMTRWNDWQAVGWAGGYHRQEILEGLEAAADRIVQLDRRA